MFIVMILAGTMFMAPQEPPNAFPVPIPIPWREEEREQPSSPAHLTGQEGSDSLVVKIKAVGDPTMEQPIHHQNNGNSLRIAPPPAGGNN